MKIRYYLRGLGIGILVTTVIFLLCDNSKQTMSDEMIKERAKELGMIESTVLADMNSTKEEIDLEATESIEESVADTTEENTLEATGEEVSEAETVTVMEETVTEEAVMEETPVDTSTQTEFVSVEESSEAEAAEEIPVGQTISIMVNKGDGSDTVSHRLHEAGLVEDPYEYDKYLMQNGYDRRISTGEHLIPSGSSWQEMAQILCN